MKKVMITAALIGVIGFAGIQAASAHGRYFDSGDNYGYGYCGNWGDNDRPSYNAETPKAYDKFRTETEGIRKDIVVKRSELNALYRQDNPDEKKVAALTGEIYDLETQIEEKAETAGLGSRFEHGPGMMYTYRGGHMMGW